MVEQAADDQNTGLFIVLGAIGIIAGGAAIYLATQPSKMGTTTPPPGLNCAGTGQSCASVACCLGPAACDPSDQICLAPGTSSSCAQVGDSCQNTICCGTAPNVVCEPSTQTCILTQNLTCANCTYPRICNAGNCTAPTAMCSNCASVDDHCDASTGICMHLCDPPCANTGDCDLSNCGSTPFDGCGTCTGPPAEWNLSGIAMQMESAVDGPVVAGDLVDMFISFNYTGPGGNVTVGYNAWLNSILGPVCSVTLTDYTPTWIAPTQLGGYLGFYTSGMTWPQMTCFFCDGCAGVVSDSVYTQPFVITPDGQTWTGATVQGLFCC